MKCSQYIDKLDDYLAGSLGKDDMESFDLHLQSCGECSEYVRIVKLSERVISKEKSLSPSYFITEKVIARIERAQVEKEGVVIRILRPAIATISVAAAIFAGIMIGNISKAPAGFKDPVELTLMNDMELQSIDVLAKD